MKLYKLTDENGMTLDNTQWGPGITHSAKGKADQPLCSNGWIHAYEHPILAVLLNPIHAAFENPKLWEAEGEIGISEPLKCGCRSLTTVAELSAPVLSLDSTVRFSIACAWRFSSKSWKTWAIGWMNGKDRSSDAANAAYAAYYAARAAADVDAVDAANTSTYAANAASSASDAAAASSAAYAAYSAAEAAAADAADAAAANADAADFIRIAEWAVTDLPIESLFPETV